MLTSRGKHGFPRGPGSHKGMLSRLNTKYNVFIKFQQQSKMREAPVTSSPASDASVDDAVAACDTNHPPYKWKFTSL